MLQIINLSAGYGKKQVLFDVSFEEKKGKIILIAGSNGSGKSTLLKTICGILPQWGDGQIIFDGENISGKQTSTLLRQGLLYVPQKNKLFDDFSVKENLQLAGITLNKRKLQERIEKVMIVFPLLKSELKRTARMLSGGERQLLAFAMSMLHEPKILLIDEPLTGLSPQNIDLVIQNLKAVNKSDGITLLVVEHRIRELLEIADTIIGLKLGKVFTKIEINETFSIDRLNPIYL